MAVKEIVEHLGQTFIRKKQIELFHSFLDHTMINFLRIVISPCTDFDKQFFYFHMLQPPIEILDTWHIMRMIIKQNARFIQSNLTNNLFTNSLHINNTLFKFKSSDSDYPSDIKLHNK